MKSDFSDIGEDFAEGNGATGCDRAMARAFINIIGKTRGFMQSPNVWFCGEPHDLLENFNDEMRRIFSDLLWRHGTDWIIKATDGKLRFVHRRAK